MTTLPREVALIERLAGAFRRSPLQLNARHESDAELIRIPGSEALLALTTDAIVEEIELGLYADPYLIGWMTVMVNASDLAAVGAAPLGILVSETLPPDVDEATIERLQRGIREACDAVDLPLLGGDTNSGPRIQTAGTAAGLIENGAPVTRKGARPGDLLFASGPLGQGAAFAFLRLRDRTVPYQPHARICEGQLLRGVASAAMDSSDGALATLDELMRLNGVGVALDCTVPDVLHPAARAVARAEGLPAWMMLAGPHGEFELLFTVPADRARHLTTRAAQAGWHPLELGRVVEAPGLRLADGTLLATARIRDRFAEVRGDVERYVWELTRLASPRG